MDTQLLLHVKCHTRCHGWGVAPRISFDSGKGLHCSIISQLNGSQGSVEDIVCLYLSVLQHAVGLDGFEGGRYCSSGGSRPAGSKGRFAAIHWIALISTTIVRREIKCNILTLMAYWEVSVNGSWRHSQNQTVLSVFFKVRTIWGQPWNAVCTATPKCWWSYMDL